MIDNTFFALCRCMLETEEGKESKPYRCPSGKLTIGIGRNLEDVGISDDTIFQMLAEDVLKCLSQARHIFGEKTFAEFSDMRRLALINMIFNLGFASFLKFKDFIALMKLQDFDLAAKSLDATKYASQVPNRVKRIKRMIEFNEWPYRKE